MPNTRLIKQVVMTPISTNGVRGKVAETWLVRCGKVLREWGIDVQDAKNLSYNFIIRSHIPNATALRPSATRSTRERKWEYGATLGFREW